MKKFLEAGCEMGYYIDLSAITLDEYKRRLAASELLPSQQVLKEGIDARFAALAGLGIQNAQQLRQALKSKKDVDALSKSASLPVAYLTVLRRELNSYSSQMRKIGDFPGIGEEIKARLIELGIRTAGDLYGEVITPEQRAALASDISASGEEVLLLAKMADVSRLRYVNPAFAALLAHSAYDTVAKIKDAGQQDLYRELIAVNERYGFYGGRINAKDMGFLIRETEYVSLDIRYD